MLGGVLFIMNTFKYHREANGYTQEDLASILNISRQAISKWENSKCLPDIENLIILCNLYKISIEISFYQGIKVTPTLKIPVDKPQKSNKRLFISVYCFFIYSHVILLLFR